MDVTVIGVPFNSDGDLRGVAGLPDALREQGLVERLGASGRSVADEGDIAFAAPLARRDPVSGIVAVASAGEIAARLRERVALATRAGRFPLVVAGECSVVLGALAAVRDVHGGAGLLFVDGHEDTWTPRGSSSGEISDMELGLALGRDLTGVPGRLRGMLPLLKPEEVVVLGPRDRREMESAGVPSLRDDLWFVDDVELRASLRDTAAAAVAHLDRTTVAWWLHIDLDVLSTAALPAVDYPQPGGLSWDQLEEVTDLALGGSGVVGMDVTIYNPDLDPTRIHARRIVDYLGVAFAV